mgnify:CR=1 FL=1|jgi:hypothetical protein
MSFIFSPLTPSPLLAPNRSGIISFIEEDDTFVLTGTVSSGSSFGTLSLIEDNETFVILARTLTIGNLRFYSANDSVVVQANTQKLKGFLLPPVSVKIETGGGNTSI